MKWGMLALVLAGVLWGGCDTGQVVRGGPEGVVEEEEEGWVWTGFVIPELAGYVTVNSVAYDPSVGFVAGSGTDRRRPAFAVSARGEEGSWRVWEVEGLENYDSYVGKVSRLGGRFLATRGSGVGFGLVSEDGEEWRETYIGFGTKGHVFGGGVYVVGGQHGQAAWSGDGMESWTVLSEGETTFDNGSMAQLYIIAGAWGNGRFVLGGGRGHTAVSLDGKAWTGAQGEENSDSERIFEGPRGFIDCMVFAYGKFIALGGRDYQDARSAWSVDGVTWTEGGRPGLTGSNDGPRMAYGGGYLVAVDSMGKAAYSEDGVRWTATDPGFGGMGIKDVAYGAGRFVVVGGGGRAAYCDVDIVDIKGDLP